MLPPLRCLPYLLGALLPFAACDRHSDRSSQHDARSESQRPRQAVSALLVENDTPARLYQGQGLEILGFTDEMLREGTTYGYFMLSKNRLERLQKELGHLCGITIPDSAGTFVASCGENPSLGGFANTVIFRMPSEEVEAFRQRVIEQLATRSGKGKAWNEMYERSFQRPSLSNHRVSWPKGTPTVRLRGHIDTPEGYDEDVMSWTFHPSDGFVKIYRLVVEDFDDD